MKKEYRKAIPTHNTEIIEAEWDGPANEAKLKNDQDAEFYYRSFAWVDGGENQNKKSSYKFIHHMTDAGGNPGAANIRACQTGIAVLNGARGGTVIPDEDRRGVYKHLASHLNDAEIEPPELRSLDESRVERRIFFDTEIRAEQREEDGTQKVQLRGVAIPFGKQSEDMGFREVFAEGSFTNVLGRSDVVALFNHNENYVLGKESAGTLSLTQTERGLENVINFDIDNQTLTDLVLRPMQRKEITGQSAGFIVARDRIEELEDGTILRTITEVEELIDVGPVTFPAYPNSEIAARSNFGVALRSIEKFKNSIATNADNSGIAEKEKENDEVDYFNSRFKEL